MADLEVAYEISADQLIERSNNRPVIPNTLSLDIGLSGGVPLGATILMGGKPKTGKSSTVLQYCAYAQQLYKTPIFFFPIEGRLTNLTFKQIRGLDTSKITVVLPPAIKDKKGNVLGNKKWPAQLWWDAIGKCIADNHNAIIIVDSISAMSSEKEVSEAMGWQGRGDLQKLEAQFHRKFGDLVISNGIALFLIAQIQANTSGYGPALQIKAGNSFKHQADIVLFVKNSEKWPEKDGKILGHDMLVTIETSAMGSPHQEVRVPLRYGYGIDNIKDVITHALNFDFIKGKGWYQLPFIEKDGKLVFTPNFEEKAEGMIKIQGEENVWKWFFTKPEQIKELENHIRKTIFA